mgnify:CR=1 FL=1
MLKRTHLALGVAVALYFLPHVNNKLIFLATVIISTMLPNLEQVLSRGKVEGALKQVFMHRGILHTYTLCIAASIFLAFFYPMFALPFFLGYSFHLTLDAFTTDGIRPFWPLKRRSTGKIRTGSKVDSTIFYILILFDLALFIKLFI